MHKWLHIFSVLPLTWFPFPPYPFLIPSFFPFPSYSLLFHFPFPFPFPSFPPCLPFPLSFHSLSSLFPSHGLLFLPLLFPPSQTAWFYSPAIPGRGGNFIHPCKRVFRIRQDSSLLLIKWIQTKFKSLGLAMQIHAGEAVREEVGCKTLPHLKNSFIFACPNAPLAPAPTPCRGQCRRESGRVPPHHSQTRRSPFVSEKNFGHVLGTIFRFILTLIKIKLILNFTKEVQSVSISLPERLK